MDMEKGDEKKQMDIFWSEKLPEGVEHLSFEGKSTS